MLAISYIYTARFPYYWKGYTAILVVWQKFTIHWSHIKPPTHNLIKTSSVLNIQLYIYKFFLYTDQTACLHVSAQHTCPPKNCEKLSRVESRGSKV